jgi:hypothetical protein
VKKLRPTKGQTGNGFFWSLDVADVRVGLSQLGHGGAALGLDGSRMRFRGRQSQDFFGMSANIFAGRHVADTGNGIGMPSLLIAPQHRSSEFLER